MTDISASAPPRKDARDLQIQLYREIGISAVAAARRVPPQPEPGPRARDKPADTPHLGRTPLAA